jgi:hypothetical protein
MFTSVTLAGRWWIKSSAICSCFARKRARAAVVAAHPAVVAVLAAEIGNLDDGAHKNFFAEMPPRRGGGALVQCGLPRDVRGEFRLGGKIAMS